MNVDPQELLLNVIEDPNTAKLLAEIWKKVEGEPLAAAKMIRAFDDVRQAMNGALKDIPAKWAEVEDMVKSTELHRERFTRDLKQFSDGTTNAIVGAIKNLEQIQRFFLTIDDDKFLNRANQILNLCDRLAKAKKDGTLDILTKILRD